MKVCIVTDSCAHGVIPSGVVVVPNTITVGGKTYREGVDLQPDEALRLFAQQPYAPLLQVPSAAQYTEVFERLAADYDAIISIHASRDILTSWQNARAASQVIMGRCEVAIIDSRTISAGQGLLVRLAARLVAESTPYDDIVRALRGAVDRIYSIYYVENPEYLMQNQIVAPAHGILGMMLNLKPVLTVEDGHLAAMEKVRTRIQAVERIVEFAVEFSDLEDAVIVQHKLNAEPTRILIDRLSAEFPNRRFPTTLYGASLAALIGVDATGLVILENELIEDDSS